ncbi:MAG: ORF6N domain-containing protein [Nitrososphaera sp.]
MIKEDVSIVPSERIANRIFVIRGKKVMLDSDLAELYEVETGALNRAAKRNINRFPEDFMFQLSKDELEVLRCQHGTSNLRSQFGISKPGRGGRRYLPLAFTEQGVAMLSTVLKSERAIAVNIQIIRTFTKLREMLATHTELRHKIEDMERRYEGQFKVVFAALKRFLIEEEKPKRQIGFGEE